MAKRKLLGITGIWLAIGFLLSGCQTLSSLILGEKAVETETSKLLLDAANDLILEKDDGIVPSTFKVAFERKFPGVTLPSMSAMGPRYQGSQITFSYEEKKYRMNFTGVAPSPWSHITSAISCFELQKAQK